MKSPTNQRRPGATPPVSSENRVGKTSATLVRPLERQVVDADEHAVLRDGKVLLHEVGALLWNREPVHRKRVLWRVHGGAAVRHQVLPGLRAPGRSPCMADENTRKHEKTAGT